MAQEEHSQKCSNSSSGGGSGGGGGGRSSKKLKQKKVPQRGLGVAQLEKIRLEEQQKRDAALQAASVLSPNSIISPSDSASCVAVQCPNFRPNLSPSSIPLPPPPPPPATTDLSSPKSTFRPSSSIQNVDHFHSNSVSLSKPLNVGRGEVGWSPILGPEHGNCPKLWNGEYNLEGESRRVNHHGFFFGSNVNFPCESNSSSWPLPSMMQRSQQFHQQSSLSMVNVSSWTSSSSAMNFQMEPPSNQSYCSNNYTPLWLEEEKMVGMKRPYPFSLDNPPGLSFPGKFPPTYFAPVSKSDDSASCGNGDTLNIEPGNPLFRDGPPSSGGISEPNSKKVIKDNGDFLTLAPPANSLPHLSSKNNDPSPYLGTHFRELSNVESLPNQGSPEDPIHRGGSCGSSHQSFFSFFPSATVRIGEAATTISNCNGEEGERVDLNLKL
ncbi:unnamed protein product [Ilex paraguariensis]|uniref:Uncharacterized protein n=1 Tax=Ilex paraguariensis TaxID=185542 RepID=A0ABC8UPF3_9AQUA